MDIIWQRGLPFCHTKKRLDKLYFLWYSLGLFSNFYNYSADSSASGAS